MFADMHGAALELAQRTASSAAPFAATLAGDCTEIAHSMRAGDVTDALAALESTTDRLRRFLTFVVVSSELLVGVSPSLGAVLGDYGRRVLSAVDRIQHALDRSDLVALTLALEHGLSPALREYEGYARDVTRALVTPRMAA